ncbi:hypothetical protein JCM10296v2_003036 [Rhodotorula toruloides]
MSSPPSPDSTAQASQRLEIPTLPSPSSRFVLPPPPSDLLSRLQAFLPQIRDANAELEGREGLGEGEEEAVVMEELSESEEDSSSDEEEASSIEEDSEGDEDEELADVQETGGPEAFQGAQELEQEEEEAGSLARLMDISAPPKVVKKNLVVEEKASSGGE